MPHQRLPELINTLKKEIHTLPLEQQDTKELVAGLEKNLTTLLEKLAESETVEIEDSPLDAALAIEAHFASQHPTATKIVREIIDILNKMGI